MQFDRNGLNIQNEALKWEFWRAERVESERTHFQDQSSLQIAAKIGGQIYEKYEQCCTTNELCMYKFLAFTPITHRTLYVSLAILSIVNLLHFPQPRDHLKTADLHKSIRLTLYCRDAVCRSRILLLFSLLATSPFSIW